MNKSYFTQDQIESLRSNPYTSFVSEKTIRFTPVFKNDFWDHYINGESPREIFRSLGYDPDVLGEHRISNFAYKLSKQRADRLKLTPAQQNQDLQKQIDFLQYEIDILKNLLQRVNCEGRLSS